NLQVIRVDPKRNGRKKDNAGTGLISLFTSPLGNGFNLEIVRTIGHVQVVRLGGPKGQDRHFPFLRAHKRMILFRQDPFAHKNPLLQYSLFSIQYSTFPRSEANDEY